MLNSEKTMFALNDVRDDHIESARSMLGYKTEKGRRHLGKKRIVTFALAAALILGLGATAYAIGVHSGFFHNAFGTGVPGHEAKSFDVIDPEGNVITVEHYPAEERVDMEEERAEELIGTYVSAVGQSVKLGDYTFTVRDVTVDENGNGAVTVDIDNPRGHGLTPEGGFIGDVVPEPWFGYSIQGSKGTLISSHDHAVAEGYSETHISFVYSITPAQPLASDEDIILRFGLYSRDNSQEESEITIPAVERVPAVGYTVDGLTVWISPVGMKLCFNDAYNDGKYEEYLVQELVISFSNGSRYVVKSSDMVNYMSAVLDSEDRGVLQITFNRLVDVDNIQEISLQVIHNSANGETEAAYTIS
ncbi:MAG: hypothetical protein Q4A40_07220 [Bacillota bacterium]|nr:hypothetical protein [Bacillota bacterium]